MNSKRRQPLGVVFPAAALLVLGLSACGPLPSSGSQGPSAGGSSPSTSIPSADPSPRTTMPTAPTEPTTPTTSAPSPQPTVGPSAAIVTIITASLESDGIEVTGIAPGQNDQAGRCTATATRDSTTVSNSAEVTVTNGNSYCPLIVLDRASLSSGTWQVVLGYDGASASGRSSAKTVVVP